MQPDLRKQIIDVCNFIIDHRVNQSTAGNIGIDVDCGLQITPSCLTNVAEGGGVTKRILGGRQVIG